MAGIADKIRLYNESYQEACRLMNPRLVHGAGDNARLDEIIRALIKAGHSDVSGIASQAVNYFRSQQK